MWLHKDEQGNVTRVFAKVANVVQDRVIIRVVQQPVGAVYFKVVDVSQLCPAVLTNMHCC